MTGDPISPACCTSSSAVRRSPATSACSSTLAQRRRLGRLRDHHAGRAQVRRRGRAGRRRPATRCAATTRTPATRTCCRPPTRWSSPRPPSTPSTSGPPASPTPSPWACSSRARAGAADRGRAVHERGDGPASGVPREPRATARLGRHGAVRRRRGPARARPGQSDALPGPVPVGAAPCRALEHPGAAATSSRAAADLGIGDALAAVTDSAVPVPTVASTWWPRSTRRYPPAWAEEWDRVGLVLGEPPRRCAGSSAWSTACPRPSTEALDRRRRPDRRAPPAAAARRSRRSRRPPTRAGSCTG